MAQPRIEYETDDRGRVKAHVYAENGEQVLPNEWYENKSNATRGLHDLYAVLAAVLVEIELPANPTV